MLPEEIAPGMNRPNIISEDHIEKAIKLITI